MSALLLRRLSDEVLGSRLAQGEAAAFDELYRRYVHRLAAYGSHLLGDGAAGDDVAQTTLLKAYTALRDGRLPERVRPWLFRIAHNTAVDTLARRRELPSADLPARAAGGGAAAGALLAALAALPERQRRVYALRELHGLRIDEAAAELGLSANQVEQALFAARNRLAEHLVFGDRLNCVSVQRLAAGPLSAEERRALKTHLRSCADCRQSLWRRGRMLTLLPAAPLDWLRGLGGGAAAGGVPIAAKVGAAVATATIAAGVPVTVHELHRAPHHAHGIRILTATSAPRRAAAGARAETPRETWHLPEVSAAAARPRPVARAEAPARPVAREAETRSVPAATQTTSGDTAVETEATPAPRTFSGGGEAGSAEQTTQDGSSSSPAGARTSSDATTETTTTDARTTAADAATAGETTTAAESTTMDATTTTDATTVGTDGGGDTSSASDPGSDG